MDKEKEINLDMILRGFEKINAGFKEEYLTAIENGMSWIMPLTDSKVVTMPGYDEEENKISIVFFVSKPKIQEKLKELKFMEVITALLIKSDFDKLRRVWSCINRLEKKGTKYRINGTEPEYDDSLGDYVFYLFISKIN